MGLKIIVTGATGMVGEGVLMACLQDEKVSEVLMVNRRHFELSHPKLKELIIPDFLKPEDYAGQLAGYDGCFYCAGISSVGMKEPQYTLITYDTTLQFAKTVGVQNPGIVFTFVSGAHTDSSEKGKLMWARVKGKTENALIQLPSIKAYNFRPGFMKPVAGQKNVKLIFKILGPVFMTFLPSKSLTLQQVEKAMVNAVLSGYPKQILEIADIKKLTM